MHFSEGDGACGMGRGWLAVCKKQRETPLHTAGDIEVSSILTKAQPATAGLG